MRTPRLLLAGLLAAGLTGAAVGAPVLTPAAVALPTAAASTLATSWDAVPVAERLQPWLAGQLDSASSAAELRVMVGGTSMAAAQAAVAASGLRVEQEWPLAGIVVAHGTPAQLRDVLGRDGVRSLEGDQPLAYALDTAHEATRSDLAMTNYTAPSGGALDGTGVTVAVIDSGIVGAHPFFQLGGSSKVVRNLKHVCGSVSGPTDTCFQQAVDNDTDTATAGGHGTHVAGIAAGVNVVTTAPAGTNLRGEAPGAKLVGLSVGAAIGLVNANAAMNWVLEHQRKPCAASTAQTGAIDPACPPIKVTNHSYGPVNTTGSDNTFSATSATVVIQRQLVTKGVVVAWAAGNDGGDGTVALTNPPGMDPTPGVLMVASYDDAQSGARDNQLSSFSSRGKNGVKGSYPDISAPGDLITSSCTPTLTICQGAPSYDGGNYQTISGTSMATPYVVGTVAKMFQADPTLTPADVERILEDSAHRFTAGAAYEADPLNPATPTSFDKGHGLLDVLAAVAMIKGLPVPDEPTPLAAALSCGGLNLVTDGSGDAALPVSGAPAGSSQDLRAISFSADATNLTVKLDVDNYTGVPGPGSTHTFYNVSWTAPDGKTYAVQYNSLAPGTFRVGQYEGGNTYTTGTTSTVAGVTRSGALGGITWTVPLTKVGSPTIPVLHLGGATPAVTGPMADVFAGEGALYFTAVVDRAPNGGKGPSWSVCTASGGEPTGGGTTAPPPVVPEVPLAILLPLAAAALAGLTVTARRRRVLV